MRHFLCIEDFSVEELRGMLDWAAVLKGSRGGGGWAPLGGQVWALVFSRASTRTRVSFEVGIRELGGG